MGYLIAGATGIAAVMMVGWLTIPHRHHPSPPPAPQVMEQEEKAYGKGDRLFIHREPAPVAAPVVVVAEQPPPVVKPPPSKRRPRDICARTGGVRVETNGGRSWRCKYR
jgi:hypothetical protein